jgi:hypothetical protein
MIDFTAMTEAQFDALVWDDSPIAPPQQPAPEPTPADEVIAPALYPPEIRCAADARKAGYAGDASPEQIAAWIDRAIASITPAVAAANKRADRAEPIEVELVGAWVWVSGTQRDDTDLRAALKQAGFLWAPKRAMWYLATIGGGNGKKDFGAIIYKYGALHVKITDD